MTGTLLLLLVVIGIPALVIFAFASAIYRGVSVKKETFTILDLEKNIEPTNKDREPTNRA